MNLPVTTDVLWLGLGLFLLALEAFGIPGGVFLFAGLASILVGILLYANLLAADAYVIQAAIFCASTGLLAALLWRPLQRWRCGSQNQAYSNMIGDFATIGKGGLKRGQIGQVSWSGTTMMAELHESSSEDTLCEGALVEIRAVRGNHLFVAPRTETDKTETKKAH